MIRGLIGSEAVQQLRQGLDDSMVRSRGIANRIANATNAGTVSFESTLEDAMGNEAVDLETEMVNLADEQIRYEAMGQMLQKMYTQIRSGIRTG